MITISEEYRALNRSLHEQPAYGTSGQKWAPHVTQLCREFLTTDVLDYGCGKGTLGKTLPFVIKEYDPCVEGKEAFPSPADVVVCTDVLEHIEPDHLEAVLDDLRRLTKKAGFFTVATVPAMKTLSDGRNAHLIQEKSGWWLPKFLTRFELTFFQDFGGEFVVVVR